MMALAQMEAIAAELGASIAELGGRVGALEAAGGPPDAIAVPNTFYVTQTGVASASGAMFWAGGFDPESAYTQGAVVSLNGRAYVNIAETTAKRAALKALPTALNQGPRLVELAKVGVTQYINPGERISNVLQPSDPPLLAVFEGATIAKVYQFRVGTVGAEVTLPENTGYKEKLLLHYSVFNANGKETLGNFAKLENKPLGEAPDTKLFFLVVFATIEGVKDEKPKVPVPFTLQLSASGAGLVEEPLNLSPAVDVEHWQEVGSARAHNAGARKLVAIGAETVPSSTSDSLNVLTIYAKAAAEASEYRVIEVGGQTIGNVQFASNAARQAVPITFELPAGTAVKVETVSGVAPEKMELSSTLID